jgi:chaperonin cofactor prefoldin
MSTRTRIATFVVALVAAAAIPTVANAATVPMRGVVSGSPYGASSGQVAIPVLFSKQTARNTGLKSPVGVIIVKRTQKVKLPNGAGYTVPVNLRTGDRFKGSGVVGNLQKRVFYPRVVFPKAIVYFRSKELSLAELSAAIASLQKSLLDLSNQLAALRDGSIKAFQDLYAQLADLRAALAALKVPAGVDLSSIQAQLDALSTKLNNLISSLPDFSQYLKIGDLTSALSANTVITGLQSQVGTLQGQVATLNAKLSTVCNAVKAATVTVPGIAVPIPITVNTGGVC